MSDTNAFDHADGHRRRLRLGAGVLTLVGLAAGACSAPSRDPAPETANALATAERDLRQVAPISRTNRPARPTRDAWGVVDAENPGDRVGCISRDALHRLADVVLSYDGMSFDRMTAAGAECVPLRNGQRVWVQDLAPDHAGVAGREAQVRPEGTTRVLWMPIRALDASRAAPDSLTRGSASAFPATPRDASL